MRPIPSFACESGCHVCCGPVHFSDAERARAATHRPLLSWTRKDGRWVPTVALETHRCPFLGESGCTIYADRPTICRLFGAVEDLRCPMGCGPKPRRMLSQAEAREHLEASK